MVGPKSLHIWINCQVVPNIVRTSFFISRSKIICETIKTAKNGKKRFITPAEEDRYTLKALQHYYKTIQPNNFFQNISKDFKFWEL